MEEEDESLLVVLVLVRVVRVFIMLAAEASSIAAEYAPYPEGTATSARQRGSVTGGEG